MEKRIGILAILVEDRTSISTLNKIFSDYSEIVLGRQGLPLKDRGISVISLIIEGTTDQIGALSGKVGKLPGVHVKSVLTKYREKNHDNGDIS